MDETQLESSGERESSVCFERINNNSNENPPQESEMMMKSSDDALGKALSSTLSSVIKDFDSRAQNTLQSQDQLDSAIHRLTQELDQLLEDAPLPFIMQHAAKISGVRKRVSSLNSLLKSIQRRVDNIDRMLSVGIVHAFLPKLKFHVQGATRFCFFIAMSILHIARNLDTEFK